MAVEKESAGKGRSATVHACEEHPASELLGWIGDIRRMSVAVFLFVFFLLNTCGEAGIRLGWC